MKYADDSLEWHDENELIRKLDAVEAVLNMADSLDDVVDILMAVPSVDYVPKEFHDKTCEAMAKAHQAEILELTTDRPQGEWIDADGNFVPLDEDGCTTASVWCSNCGEWLTGSDEYCASGRFCPNCGARMKGADDGSDNI